MTLQRFRLTGDLFALFVQQLNNILTDTERNSVGLSAIAELLVLLGPLYFLID